MPSCFKLPLWALNPRDLIYIFLYYTTQQPYFITGCAIIVGLVEQLSQVHSTDVIDAGETYLCGILPNLFQKACNALLEIFGPAIIDGVYHNETPDIICHNVSISHLAHFC